MRTLKTLAASAAVAALMLAGTAAQAAPCGAGINFGAAFAADYSCTTLGTPSGIPANLGGLTFLDNNTLLIGGAANGGSGVIRMIDVLRDGNNHIIGFDGVSSAFADAPYIDGGLAYGPGGVLFATTFSNNTLLQFKPGSASPDKIIDLTAEGIASSTGTLQFVPLGFNGAGGFKIASYSAGTWYDVTLTADGSGTYDIGAVTYINTPGRGPEGIVYVDGANDGFGVDRCCCRNSAPAAWAPMTSTPAATWSWPAAATSSPASAAPRARSSTRSPATSCFPPSAAATRSWSSAALSGR